jgi:murein DD-endopeptidase MepM/ murein hydrolase activator NlpD
MKSKLFLLLLIVSQLKVAAEFEVNEQLRYPITSGVLKLAPDGILAGEYSNYPFFSGVYLDKGGNLEFYPEILKDAKITSLGYDSDYFYATTYNTTTKGQGLMKISKNFSSYENIGFKGTATSHYLFNTRAFVGYSAHGIYVVDKNGQNLKQILGYGYYGPDINTMKGNSHTFYALSLGEVYKINPSTLYVQRLTNYPGVSNIEVDENFLYISQANTLTTINSSNNKVGEKYFPNKITFLKKYLNYFLVVESDLYNSYFWFSNDHGKTFYKSKYKLPTSNNLKSIEFTGSINPTAFLLIQDKGIYKGKLDFDFSNQNQVFQIPFDYKKSTDLVDKITSFFDHRYPYLGNKSEPSEFSSTTLNYLGKELPEPYQYYSSHDGIDWALPLNANIYSVYDGKATYFYQPNGLGHTIRVDHQNGYITIYGHLSDQNLITTSTEVSVKKGQKIGQVGMSGNTSGPHLHFTVYKGTKDLPYKTDPFGWEGNFEDPWIQYGVKSDYLWEIKNKEIVLQKNAEIFDYYDFEHLTLVLYPFEVNLPVNLYIKNIPPVYDFNNFKYIPNTSYQTKTETLLNHEANFSNAGFISFKGFNSVNDELNKSIWKWKNNKLIQVETTYNDVTKTLDTEMDPNADFLILQKKYQRISSKAAFSTRK